MADYTIKQLTDAYFAALESREFRDRNRDHAMYGDLLGTWGEVSPANKRMVIGALRPYLNNQATA